MMSRLRKTKTSVLILAKNSRAAKYNTKYNPSWGKIYPLKAVPNDRHSCFCIPCGKKIRCGHQGLRDIKVHCNCDSHKKNVTAANKNSNISQFHKASTGLMTLV